MEDNKIRWSYRKPPTNDTVGFMLIDKKGIFHDVEEYVTTTVGEIKPMFDDPAYEKIMFSYNEADRIWLVLAADKLGVGVSYLLGHLAQILRNTERLEYQI